MKQKIVADGPARLAKARHDRAVTNGRAKHSETLKDADWFERILLHMAHKHEATKSDPKQHRPFPSSLWIS